MLELFYYLMDQGTFMALFVVLLIYTTKKADDRENKYISIINELIKRSADHVKKENIIK